jgi:hypothetical protein
MSRSRRDRLLALVGAFCLVAGVAIAATGSGDDPYGGAVVVLFGLVMLVIPASGWLMARNAHPPRVDRIEHDGVIQPALVIPGYAAKVWLLRLAALGFGALGVLLAIGGAVVIGVVCAAFLGVGGLLTLFARGPYRIVLLPGELRWELGAKPSSVDWEDIEAVRVFSIRDSPFLGLDARPGMLRTPASQRWLAGVNRAISASDGQISLEAFAINPERLAGVIADCAEDARRRREIGTPGSLAWLSD